MADSSEKPWSDDPNAPKIPYSLHIQEREKFTGDFLAGILYGMPAASSSIRIHFVCLTDHSRNHRRSVLLVYDCTAPSSQSSKRGYQMGTRDPHRLNVLYCDDINRIGPQPSIYGLYRWPGIPWWRGVSPWTHGLQTSHLRQGHQSRS